MAKKKKRIGEILQSIEILTSGAEGQSIAKVDGKVIFVERAVPGDVVDLKITSDRRGWLVAEITQIIKPSENRVTPFCEHFNVCGGCKWQQMHVDQQRLYKQQQVNDAMQRIGKVEVEEVLTIAAGIDTVAYRNKLEFTFSNKGYLAHFDANNPDHFGVQALGYHVPGRFDKVFDANKCHLMREPANMIRNGVRDFCKANGFSFYDLYGQKGLMRNLMMRNTNTGQWMVVVVFGEDQPEQIQLLMQYIQSSFAEITSLHYCINTKKNDSLYDQDIIYYSGNHELTEKLGTLSFKIRPKSFFQTNSTQAEKLYEIAKEFAELTGTELVYDLYSGTGTIGLFVADKCAKVIGIEYIEDAVKDAYENAKMNHISHAEFYAGDMVKVLNNDFIIQHGKPQVIITDPPRAGMHADVVAKILEIAPEKIVYISCNPATQARDLEMMKDQYHVRKIQPVDMFPHTHHVENVALLVRK
jgi:23S rRNA (uracil1939-C5)-methyltransferase